MAHRFYVLAKVEQALEQPALAQLVRQLEDLEEVIFAEPVVGQYDLLITLETARPLETVLEKLAAIKPLCGLVGLKADLVPPRDRLRRNLEKIPLAHK